MVRSGLGKHLYVHTSAVRFDPGPVRKKRSKNLKIKNSRDCLFRSWQTRSPARVQVKKDGANHGGNDPSVHAPENNHGGTNLLLFMLMWYHRMVM
jgi:hypothetical protein